MRFDVLTLFPRMFDGILGESILKRAIEAGLIQVEVHDLRFWSADKHHKVDDKPYGGGPGMVMRPEPLFAAVEELQKRVTKDMEQRSHVVLVSPQGERFTQKVAARLAEKPNLLLICGHYEGVDQRAIDVLVDEEISIGDVVLTGGEIPAMALVDGVARLLPGVLGDESSTQDESFSEGRLEYPHYTRPAEFRGMNVPGTLISGDHSRVARWRSRAAFTRTLQRRPDLLL
ncbi:MAG: tRNA (guanosine(37)-N1)-methyltransferase TrmD [Candidatus Omnitrophica bacterium]|nr:tRNA (guanosine(37)-N1)-methyltransferase TrmD [Candidatus Omnitrophota bacterium]